MNIRHVLTIAVAKTVKRLVRTLGSGGSSLPGRLALLVDPGILAWIAAGFQTIAVTGTNGKTTTTAIISQILEDNGIPHIVNNSGANLASGISTTFLDAVDILGHCRIKTALIECDEAAFGKAAGMLEPDILVVTNFFRDQLDRYGELHSILNGISGALRERQRTRLVLNADDSLCVSLAGTAHTKPVFFGIGRNALAGREQEANSDAQYCLRCKSRYSYSYHTYGHLGCFSCPSCGFSRPVSDITCSRINDLKGTHSSIELEIEGLKEARPARVNLPGLYNVYNALAGVACAKLLCLPVEKALGSISRFRNSFGRMETIRLSGKSIKLILVKNPAGFNQVIQYLKSLDGSIHIAFAINDRAADGMDVSWLWDVDFESLYSIQGTIERIYACGTRKEDLAVRLKYAGFNTEVISNCGSYGEMISRGLKQIGEGQCLYILPTYTAMLNIRKSLKYKSFVEESREECMK